MFVNVKIIFIKMVIMIFVCNVMIYVKHVINMIFVLLVKNIKIEFYKILSAFV